MRFVATLLVSFSLFYVFATWLQTGFGAAVSAVVLVGVLLFSGFFATAGGVCIKIGLMYMFRDSQIESLYQSLRENNGQGIAIKESKDDTTEWVRR